MSNIHNLSSLLRDYIEIFRNVQREQHTALITYLNSQREMNAALNDLLIRYLEIERTYQNNRNTSRNRNMFSNAFNSTFNSTSTPNRFPPIPPSPPLFSFGNSNNIPNTFSNSFTNNRGPLQSPINNNSWDWPSNTTNTTNHNPISTTEPTLMSRGVGINSSIPRDPTITTFPRRRRPPLRRAPRIRATTNVTTTTIPRDVFQNFINNTLNMGNIPQPLNSQDISANITNLTYGEIAETTNQTICPFTQENFVNSDEIARINPCGHIFTRIHLSRYLRNFDYRCPICRRDLRRENDVENPPPSTTNLIDVSNTVVNPTNRTSHQTRSIINNAVESVTNALMNNITSQITNDPSRNSFVAEYSFLLPQFNTTNSTSTADLDIHDYLGIPLSNRTIQTPLPPLPEDDDSDMPELMDELSDDEDL